MKTNFIQKVIALFVIVLLPNLGVSQSKIRTPRVVKITPKNSDTRTLAYVPGGQSYLVSSDSWSMYGTCWYWGMKDTLPNIINGSNSNPPNMACSGLSALIINPSLSKPDSGRLIYTGSTFYKYVSNSSYGNYIKNSVSVRLSIKLTDTFGSPLSFTDIDSAYVYRASKNFKVQVFLEALGPADALNCYLYGSCNNWVPAIKLFDYLHTDPYTSICTSVDLGNFWEISTKASAFNTGPYCSGDTIELNGSGGASPTWKLSDSTIGYTSKLRLPNATSPVTFKFFTTGKWGCMDTTSTTVLINPNPEVAFNINDSVQCLEKNSFDFLNATKLKTGSFTSTWEINNPKTTTDSQSIVGYTFKSIGTYTIKLVVKSNFGCMDSLQKNIVLNANPEVNPQVDSTCIYRSANCFGNGRITNDSIVKFDWIFSDGSTLDQENGKIQFLKYGKIKGILEATSSNGCTGKDSVEVNVYSTPTVDFNFKPNGNICSGTAIDFSSMSTNNFGKIEDHHWDFGDNSGSKLENLTKWYYVKNTTSFNVTLVVTGEGNCKDSIVKRVDIQENPKTCKFDATSDYGNGYWGIKMKPMDSLNVVGGEANVEYEFIIVGVDTILSTGSLAEALFKLNVDGTYNLKIKARSTLGGKCSCESNIIPFKLDRLYTVENGNATINYYPNPIESGNDLYISQHLNQRINKVLLFSNNGSVMTEWNIFNKEGQPISLPIPTLSSGVYFLQLYTEINNYQLPLFIK